MPFGKLLGSGGISLDDIIIVTTVRWRAERSKILKLTREAENMDEVQTRGRWRKRVRRIDRARTSVSG